MELQRSSPFVALRESPVTDRNNIRNNRWFTPAVLKIALPLLAGLIILLYLLSAKSLYLRVNADSFNADVDGWFTFPVADHFLLLAGEHEIQISAPGYSTHRSRIEITSESTQYADVTLEPLPGHLTVDVNTDALISIDGQVIGKSGEIIPSLAAGQHLLEISAERYQPLQQTITIEGRDRHQQLSLTLQPDWAELTIDSIPQGATVIIDDQVIGTTPLMSEVLSGRHILQLRLGGYKSWQQIVRVNAGQHQALPLATLQTAGTVVTINSQPSGASITIDNQYIGKTPLQTDLSPEQSHALSLLKEGYKPLLKTITLGSEADSPSNSSQPHALNYTLQPTLGSVQISTTPADALLYIDDQLFGRATRTLTLPTRPHRLRISKPGFADHIETLTPKESLTQTLSITLLTEEQQHWKNLPTQLSTVANQTLLLFKPKQTFTMGASRREQGRRANEAQNRVTLNRAFYLAEQLVSNAEFRQFDRFHSSGHVKGNSLNGDDYPAVNISWEKAALYCNWLSAQENLPAVYQVKDERVIGVSAEASGYRLPTETEWAWAARLKGDEILKYGWGNQLPPPPGFANLGDRTAAPLLGNILPNYSDGFAVTSPAKKFAPNHRNLYDITGNAAEWVNDFYGIASGLSQQITTNPHGPESGDFHVIRGSSWAHGGITELRLAFRDYGVDGRNDVGFRIARNVE